MRKPPPEVLSNPDDERTIAYHAGLRLYNGRGDFQKWEHFFVAAGSDKEVVELLKKAGHAVTLHEVRGYFHKDCWGDQMKGIRPDHKGVWATRIEDGVGSGKPVPLFEEQTPTE